MNLKYSESNNRWDKHYHKTKLMY